MATLLAITNKVLARLREDTVTDLTAAYPALVAAFVADIVQELNEATVWNYLDHEVTVTTVASTQSYTLTATLNTSHLLWNCTGPAAWVYDTSSTQQGTQLIYMDPSEFWRQYNLDQSATSAKPTYFTIEKDTTNDILKLRLWPTPDTSGVYYRIRFNTPEAELVPASDAATEIAMPDRVVRLGALHLALNERGEEIGEPGNIAEQRYTAAKGAAIENEIRARERSGFYDWKRN